MLKQLRPAILLTIVMTVLLGLAYPLGMTGLAQVSGRTAIPWSERIEMDLTYVDRWSIRRDLAILARTVLVVVRRESTYKGPRGGFDLP